MEKFYDIIVVGAGVIGSAFVLHLARKTDLRIAVLEKSHMKTQPLERNQKVFALGQQAMAILEALNITEKISPIAQYPYQAMHVWDANSEGELHFDAQEHGLEQLGYIVDADYLHFLLQKKVHRHPNIDFFSNTQIQQLDNQPSKVRVRTQDTVFVAQVLVAADGARSWVRKQSKIDSTFFSYGQSAIVAQIETEKSHCNTAWQVFDDKSILAILPLAHNRASIVWSVPNSLASQYMQMQEKAFCKHLRCAFEGRLAAMQLRSERFSYPLYSLSAQKYHRRRVVLIGDAAHNIHPLAGQGANLGFKDIASLGAIFANGDALSVNTLHQYELARKMDNVHTDKLMSFLHCAFGVNNVASSLVRAKGMNWINQSKWVKSILIQNAIGVQT